MKNDSPNAYIGKRYENFTFRYAPALKAKMRRMVDDRLDVTTINQWLIKLVEEEWGRFIARQREQKHRADLPKTWEPKLAIRFAQFCPACFVVKHKVDILYANAPYAFTIGKGLSLTDLRKSKVADLVGQEDALAIEVNTKQALDSGKPTESIEAVSSNSPSGKMKSIYRALRFSFKGRAGSLLADFSFDWSEIVDGELRDLRPDLLARIEEEASYEKPQQYVFDALEQAPVAIAIKRAEDLSCLWCNDMYVSLANAHCPKGQKLSRQQICGGSNKNGMTAQQIFKLEDDHAIAVNEREVVNRKKWLYDTMSLKPDGPKRTSLRFPMLEPDGSVGLIGVISTDFKQEAYKAAVSWVHQL